METLEQINALDGKEAQEPAYKIDGCIYTVSQFEDALLQCTPRQAAKARKQAVAGFLRWTWKKQYSKLGGGYWGAVKENLHFTTQSLIAEIDE